MKLFKKILSLSLAAMMLLSAGVCACADASSAESQISLISRNLVSFAMDEAVGKWYYAVTDFDHNGRLEIVAAAKQGLSSAANIWEVSETYDGFVKCGMMIASDESFPDILSENADTYYNAAKNVWSYMFSDAENNGTGFSSSVGSISLMGGNFVYQLFASESSEIINGYLAVTFMDADGKIITPEEYTAAAAAAFEGCERSSTSFGWFRFSDAEASEQALKDSYAVFMGETAPAEESVIREDETLAQTADAVPVLQEEAPAAEEAAAPAEQEQLLPEKTPEGYDIVMYSSQETPEIVYPQEVQPQIQIVYPTPVPTPAFVAMYVTRHPTNEFRRVGDTAKFVACANVFDGLTWMFVSPDGSDVSVQFFAAAFPGVSVDSSSTTLRVTGVTAQMNGWGAYCTFRTNNGQIARTNTAYIVLK